MLQGFQPIVLALALAVAAPAVASIPGPAPVPAPDATTRVDTGVVKMRSAEGTRVIGQMVSDESFWAGAWRKTYTGQVYDELRLKELPSGYLPMITGEGQQDFEHDLVAHVIFNEMHRLPYHMSGVRAVASLGRGHDPRTGTEYRDTFWFLDLGVLYMVFPMRMYREHDPASTTTWLWFEKLDESFVDGPTWAAYQAKIQKTMDSVERRWTFNSVNPVETLYGIFVVEPGRERESRVVFATSFTFGQDAGWMAKLGSQLPGVLKAGLRTAFNAAVAIAKDETEKRARATQTPPAGAPAVEPPAVEPHNQ